MANDTASPTVPVGTLAKLFNLTEVRVQQLAKMGVVIKGERGRYDLWASVRGYVRYLQDRAAGKSGGDGDGGNYEKHRTRLYAARADAQEVLANRLKGTVHDAEVIASVMNEMIANARSKFLAVPTTAAPKVADLSDPNECKAVLTDAVHECLTELADYPAAEIVARQLNQAPPEAVTEDPEPGEA